MGERGLHHVAITATDLELTGRFYDGVLEPAGYSRHLTLGHILSWQGPGPELLIYKARPESGKANEDIYSPGLHHLAFEVETRLAVEQVHDFARESGFRVLDAPASYDRYSAGYYAVYLLDPDGAKVEIAHIPVPTS